MDKAIFQLSEDTRERRNRRDAERERKDDERERRDAERENRKKTPAEAHYGLQVAETLDRFTPQQKVQAKLRIQQILMEIEFPSAVSQTMPAPPSNYYSEFTDY